MSTVLKSLNMALHRAMERDERVMMIGEDILDPYGGAFKVTEGLSSKFPGRVWSSPISEAGIVGVAAGMAMRGLRPVVEIMFGDFLTLAADQIVNHITKFRWMYNDQVSVPLVIRTPMGGRRGYGPTHSQTIEKLFIGVPGLKVVAPCTLQTVENEAKTPGELLLNAIADDDPVLFVENKLLYLLKLQSSEMLTDFTLKINSSSPDEFNPYSSKYPTFHLAIQGAPPANLTMIAYGYMAELAREAALKLAYENEIFTEIIVPTQLAPFDNLEKTVPESIHRTKRLLIIEEGTLTLGWGSEILARVVENPEIHLKAAKRVAALEYPVPASSVLEKNVLPDVDDIINSVRTMV